MFCVTVKLFSLNVINSLQKPSQSAFKKLKQIGNFRIFLYVSLLHFVVHQDQTYSFYCSTITVIVGDLLELKV